MPGGRINPGETFLETLERELREEIRVSFVGIPRQLMGMLTKITIPLNNVLTPHVFIIYEAELPTGAKILLDPSSAEDDYKWLSLAEAARAMAIKFSADFCDLVRNL